MFHSSALDSGTNKPRVFLTLVRLKVCPGSFDSAQRAGAGLQDENGGSEGPRQLRVMAWRGATFRQTQVMVSSRDADAWRWAARPDNTSIDTCSSLYSRHLIPSFSVQWRAISGEREAKGRHIWHLQRSLTGDMGREMDRGEAKKGLVSL